MPKRRLTPDGLLSWWPVMIRIGGLVIALYETIFDHVDRPSLLVLAAGMMGLQEVVRAQDALADRAKKRKAANGSGKRE